MRVKNSNIGRPSGAPLLRVSAFCPVQRECAGLRPAAWHPTAASLAVDGTASSRQGPHEGPPKGPGAILIKHPSGPRRPARLALTMTESKPLHFVSTDVPYYPGKARRLSRVRPGKRGSAGGGSPCFSRLLSASESKWRVLLSTFRAGDSPPDVNGD